MFDIIDNYVCNQGSDNASFVWFDTSHFLREIIFLVT